MTENLTPSSGKSPESTDSEARIQQQIVQWYHNSHCLRHSRPRCLIIHIPNEGMHRQVAIGLRGGAADLMVIHRTPDRPEPRVIFWEVKTPKGKQSDKQKDFENQCREIGVEYYVVRSKSEAEATLAPKSAELPFLE